MPAHRENGALPVKITDTHGTSADHFDYLDDDDKHGQNA